MVHASNKQQMQAIAGSTLGTYHYVCVMNVLLPVIHTWPCPPYPKLHITISNTLHTIRQWMSGLRPVQYSTIDLVLSSVCGTPLILCVVFVVFSGSVSVEANPKSNSQKHCLSVTAGTLCA